MKKTKIMYDEALCNNGLHLQLNIVFVEDDEKKTMELLQCSFSNSYRCIDFGLNDVAEITIKDVIEYFGCEVE